MVTGSTGARWILCAGLPFFALSVAAAGEPEPKLTVTVPLDGAWVGAKFVVKGKLTGAPKGAQVHVGVEDATVADDGSFALTVTAESEGPRTIRVLYGPVGEPAIFEARDVTVDTTPPTIDLISPDAESAMFGGEEATVSGHIHDIAPVALRINGRKVKVGADGRFESVFVLPAEGEVVLKLELSDAAGNAAPPVIRKLSRWIDHGPPALSFEGDGVFWIARDGVRILLVGDAEKDARAIGEHERTIGPTGAVGQLPLAEIRATGATPFARFSIGWGILKLLAGSPFVTAPLPDPATAEIKADVIDFLPTAEKDGSWRVRIGSKEWVIAADDVRDSAGFDQPIPAGMAAVLDEVAALLKAHQKLTVVRLRLAEPIPRRLLESVWLAGYVHARSDVIIETYDPTIVEKPVVAPPAPVAPPVDRARLETVLMSTNVPLAVTAAKELADNRCLESIPALRIALGKATTGPVRGAAAKALGRMNDLDSIAALIELLRTPNGDLAEDADIALSQMSGLGRVLKSTTPLDQRIPISERYAHWWKGAEVSLRKKKADAAPAAAGATPNSPKPEQPPGK